MNSKKHAQRKDKNQLVIQSTSQEEQRTFWAVSRLPIEGLS
jgi:hypothetical protein